MPPGMGSLIAMFTNVSEVILLVFYVYLLARWQYVRRPMFYLLGVAGLLFGMLGGFFGTSETGAALARIFGTVGTMVAFAAVVGACFGAQLPVNLPSSLTGSGSPTPPPPAK